MHDSYSEIGGYRKMDLGSLVEGPILWIAFLMFIAGIIVRGALFFNASIRNDKCKDFGWENILATFGCFFSHLHEAFRRRPFYVTMCYAFHICMIVVPIWLGGHIILWEESRFGWNWAALPDVWTDWMTLFFLGFSVFFLARRIILADIRLSSSKSDYVLIVITSLPFITGYFLTHGHLGSLSFLRNNMRIIHVLSGEAMLIVAVFLFCKIRLEPEKCICCAACELGCPTGTLESHNEENFLILTYAHSRCLCCGVCVDICPEKAADFGHEIGVGNLLKIFVKDRIRCVELAICKRCGAFFAPMPQLDKIVQVTPDDHVNFCPKCKRNNLADILHQLAPFKAVNLKIARSEKGRI